MKYYILIDTSNNDRNNNVLVMEHVLAKGMAYFFSGRGDTAEQKAIIAELIKEHQDTSKYNIEYLYLDEDEMSIPMSSYATLVLKDGETDRFFGDHLDYVLSLYAEDLKAVDKNDIDELSYASDCPKQTINLETKNGEVQLTAICVSHKIFD